MIPALFVLWALKTLGTVPQSTYYWQLKEYRWDRMREFFLQQGGRQIFFTLFDALLVLSLFIGFFFIYLPEEARISTELYGSLIGVIFLASFLESLHLIVTRKWKRPKATLKALLIMILTVVFELFIIGTISLFVFESLTVTLFASILAIVSVLDHDINAFSVFLLNTLTNFQKRRLYKKARQKRVSFKDLKVVGITGSYGKSSVKEFLSQILETKYKVLKTPANTNTEIGIAQTILRSLKSSHEVFVCEMGAYKMGEIRVCCSMAKPQIGIFTGLNEQHLALFGSLDKTFTAKSELLHALPAEGLAIVNADSKPLSKRLEVLRAKTIKVSTGDGDAVVKDLQVSLDHFSFKYRDQLFKAPLVGSFHAVNVLMAIVAAEQLGMNLGSIAKAVASLKAPQKTMELKKIPAGVLIDESYNVNPDGLRVALKHLETFEDHQKILFFPGILELGDKSEQIHRELGKIIAEHVDQVFFTDSHFSENLQKGALLAGLTRTDIHLLSDQQEQIEKLKEILEASDEKSVILFESRGSEKVMKWLEKK